MFSSGKVFKICSDIQFDSLSYGKPKDWEITQIQSFIIESENKETKKINSNEVYSICNECSFYVQRKTPFYNFNKLLLSNNTPKNGSNYNFIPRSINKSIHSRTNTETNVDLNLSPVNPAFKNPLIDYLPLKSKMTPTQKKLINSRSYTLGKEKSSLSLLDYDARYASIKKDLQSINP